MRENFECARSHRANIHIAHRANIIERVGRIVEHLHSDRSEGAGGMEPAALKFVCVVKQCVSPAGLGSYLCVCRTKDSHPAFRRFLVQRTNAVKSAFARAAQWIFASRRRNCPPMATKDGTKSDGRGRFAQKIGPTRDDFFV